ncbi:MAG: pyridoxal-dependent decarboxylase [Actinomycetota bacterium]
MTTDEALLRQATEHALAHLGTGDRPVFPAADTVAGLDDLLADLPDDPGDPAAVLDHLHALGSPATVDSTGGRYFGFVTGGTEPVARAAAVIAAAWDQNAAVPVMSPVAARLDAIASTWVCDLLGLGSATATFCGGATVANLTAIIAGRDALLRRAGWDVDADGLTGAPPIEVVTSAEIHVSVRKALRLAGIGQRAVIPVDTDDAGRLRADRLPAIGPRTMVIAQAGNVNTGHSDPFPEVIDAARATEAWVHVDGAFGLWAAASDHRRHLVAGMEHADSWATDAHKWLNVTYDSAVAICARAEDLRLAMTADAAYLPGSDERANMHHGIQMSQRARAIEVWAVLATLGRSGLAALIDRTCDQAARFADRLAAAGVGAEVLAPVVLNQVLVSFGDDTRTDAVIAAVQTDGTCWVGPTTWQGRRAMRISVSDAATTDADIDTSATAIAACAHRL